jgi:site-specific DNA-methyltransferase (adenine-specific)
LKTNKIYLGDNLELLKQLENNSIHSCVSDFPYNLGFMGIQWDTISNYYDWCKQRADELFRVLKSGGYCLIFGGTRTHHRLVCAFEDAGFEIKDEIQWIYSSGFPKSYNISKGFDKQNNNYLSKEWYGWGTTLKPAQEPIMVAQKPIEKNYCYNIEKYGVGGLNINGCRVPYKNQKDLNTVKAKCNFTENSKSIGFGTSDTLYGNGITPLNQARDCVKEEGRFPANIIFDEETREMLDEQSGITKSGKVKENKDAYQGKSNTGFLRGITTTDNQYGDEGGASRFFYCAKATKKDKTENVLVDNTHVTVKPTPLIKYLVRLVTPKNGICLDVCEGSGTHAKACIQLTKENYPVNYIGFENDEESYNISLERISINSNIN